MDISCGRQLLQRQHKTEGERCLVEEPSIARDSKSSKRRFEGAKGGGTGTELDVRSETVKKFCKMPEPLEAAEGVLVPTDGVRAARELGARLAWGGFSVQGGPWTPFWKCQLLLKKRKGEPAWILPLVTNGSCCLLFSTSHPRLLFHLGFEQRRALSCQSCRHLEKSSV